MSGDIFERIIKIIAEQAVLETSDVSGSNLIFHY